jgi:hypothetical protein
VVPDTNRALYLDIVLCGVLTLMLIVPTFFNQGAVMCICAGALSAQISIGPDRFRSRRGSLKPAIVLASAMWGAAALVTAFGLVG